MSSAEIRAKSEAEAKAQSIILAELNLSVPSYQQVLQLDYTGYTHAYLFETADLKNLKSTAILSVVLELAECDLFWIENHSVILVNTIIYILVFKNFELIKIGKTKLSY